MDKVMGLVIPLWHALCDVQAVVMGRKKKPPVI